jgi:hypothetical protein
MADKYEIACNAMQCAFEKAAIAHSDKRYEINLVFGGQSVRMQLVGKRLAQRLRLPFSHLETNDLSRPERLSIAFWDEGETGVACPMSSILGDELGVAPVMITGSADNRFVVNKLRRSVTCLDRKTRHIIGWTSAPEQFSLHEIGRPLHSLLSVWHLDHEMTIIHAGLVSKSGTGIIFAGSSGAGKTTAAIACLCSGFHYLSEDQVALQQSNGGPVRGHSLYSSAFLEADHLARFPLLAPHAIEGIYPDEQKWLVLLASLFPSKMQAVTDVGAVVLPRIVGNAASRIRSASKSEALLALAPSSLIIGQLSSGIRGFSKLAELVERVSCYWLELGSDNQLIPDCLEQILAKV